MTLMSLLTLIVVLAIIGFAVWLVTTYVPMPAPFKTAIIVLTVLLLLLWIVSVLLGGGGLGLRVR